MENNIEYTKKQLRAQIISKRKQMSVDDVVSFSDIIFDKVTKLDEYKKAEKILIYCSYNNEVFTYRLIFKALIDGKKVYAPVIVGKGLMDFYNIESFDELEPNRMGIMEPKVDDLKKYTYRKDSNDVIICPGVAFDKENNRLGYGGGFYDRFLQKNPVKSIALAYKMQIMDEGLETLDTDVKMDLVITQ